MKNVLLLNMAGSSFCTFECVNLGSILHKMEPVIEGPAFSFQSRWNGPGMWGEKQALEIARENCEAILCKQAIGL